MMKRAFIFYLFLICSSVQAQPDLVTLQQQWVDSVKAGESTFGFYWSGRSLVYTKINTKDAQSLIQLAKSEEIAGLQNYNHIQTYQHDKFRYITIGELKTHSDSLMLLTGWRDIDGRWEKEIDVILTLKNKTTEISRELDRLLNQERKEWVKLANQHNPEAHIKTSYTEDATYFGNGQKSEGQQEIAERYFYMENPNYQVDLEKERLWKISEENVLEIGRYFTGPKRVGDGGIYVILWEKQESGEWLIQLDFNF